MNQVLNISPAKLIMVGLGEGLAMGRSESMCGVCVCVCIHTPSYSLSCAKDRHTLAGDHHYS